MFSGCSLLVGGKGTAYGFSFIDAADAVGEIEKHDRFVDLQSRRPTIADVLTS